MNSVSTWTKCRYPVQVKFMPRRCDANLRFGGDTSNGRRSKIASLKLQRCGSGTTVTSARIVCPAPIDTG